VKDQLPSCWEIELVEGESEAGSPRSWIPSGSLPRTLRLDTVRVEKEGEGRASREESFRAESFGGLPGQSFSVWRRTKGDSIRVQQKGALGGVMLQFKIREKQLAGSVIGFKDATGIEKGRKLIMGKLRTRAPIKGEVVECPNESSTSRE
jgi:hypothetical protein